MDRVYLADIPQMDPRDGANASILPGFEETVSGRHGFHHRFRHARPQNDF
jgi:hypothetical protein